MDLKDLKEEAEAKRKKEFEEFQKELESSSGLNKEQKNKA